MEKESQHPEMRGLDLETMKSSLEGKVPAKAFECNGVMVPVKVCQDMRVSQPVESRVEVTPTVLRKNSRKRKLDTRQASSDNSKRSLVMSSTSPLQDTVARAPLSPALSPTNSNKSGYTTSQKGKSKLTGAHKQKGKSKLTGAHKKKGQSKLTGARKIFNTILSAANRRKNQCRIFNKILSAANRRKKQCRKNRRSKLVDVRKVKPEILHVDGRKSPVKT